MSILSISLISCSSDTKTAGTISESATPSPIASKSAAGWLIESGAGSINGYTFYSEKRGAFSDDSKWFGKEDYWQMNFRCSTEGDIQISAALRPTGDDPGAYTYTGVFKNYKDDQTRSATYLDGTPIQIQQVLYSDDSVLVFDQDAELIPEGGEKDGILAFLGQGGINIKSAEFDVQFNWGKYDELLSAMESGGCQVK
jgi:hypothetical protein